MVRLQLAACTLASRHGPISVPDSINSLPQREHVTMMGSAAPLCVASLLEAAAGSYVMTDSTIKPAVDAWVSDATSAEATYGHISTWDTSGAVSYTHLTLPTIPLV